MLLLPEQDLLMIISEKGELVLAEANPDRYKELANFKVLEGKTWNHPIFADDLLIVRNTKEMAAYKLALSN